MALTRDVAGQIEGMADAVRILETHLTRAHRKLDVTGREEPAQGLVMSS